MPKKFQLTGASVIVYKDNRILLQQRQDNKCWGYPGGRIELGEIVEEAAKRETLEETGLTVRSLELFGVFSGPDLHHVYPDGNEVDIIDIVFITHDFSGELKAQESEVRNLQWFDMGSVPEEGQISPPVRRPLRTFLEAYRKQF